MVNPKAAIPQLVNAIKRKITECQDYATDYEGKAWDSFVESGAVELLEAIRPQGGQGLRAEKEAGLDRGQPALH